MAELQSKFRSSNSFLAFFSLAYDAALNLCWIIFLHFIVPLNTVETCSVPTLLLLMEMDQLLLDKMREKERRSKKVDFMLRVFNQIKKNIVQT